MIWLVLALLVAFATLQSVVIERFFRDQRRTLAELDEIQEQFDALAVAMDSQLLTQKQLEDQAKPVAAAIRESNKVVAESVESLLGSIREAKTERRRLQELIATAAATDMSRAATSTESHANEATPGPDAGGSRPTPKPLAWPDADSPIDVTSIVGTQRRKRNEVVVSERATAPFPSAKKATG